MCVIFFAFGVSPDRPLIVAANRDEFYDRPTAAAARWNDHPHVTAGRDLVAGGTWLGVTDGGRFAAVTNYRESNARRGPRSRGGLVADFLTSNDSAQKYLERIEAAADEYSGFNLLVCEIGERGSELFYFSNRENSIRRLEPGIYGLSNHLLNTAWPKVTRGMRRFEKLVATPAASVEDLFNLLADETLADDAELPETGVGVERERALSPIFIRTPVYGTRSSTIVTFRDGRPPELIERTYV